MALRTRPMPVLALAVVGLSLMPAAALEVGDRLPDCSKIPLASVRGSEGRSVEELLVADGVLIVHFASPRPAAGATFRVWLAEELSALRKATVTTTYPCRAVVVLPFGRKSGEDAYTVLAATEADSRPWGGGAPLYYEPTFPRPGLYRTFRPEAEGASVKTPLTWLIGPDRRILAVRTEREGGQLYDWLVAHLPASLTATVPPRGTDLSTDAPSTWVWPMFRRSASRVAEAQRLPDTSGYTYLAWRAHVGRTLSSPVVVDQTVYLVTDGGLQVLSLDSGELVGSDDSVVTWWSTPAVAGDRLFAVTTDGQVTAFDRSTLETVWRTELRAMVTSSPVVREGAVYLGARDGALYALDAGTGERLWAAQTGGAISSSPAVLDDLVLIGSGDRRLYALNAADGEVRWSYETGGPVDATPTVAGEAVVFGSFDGCLYAVALADGKLRWRCELGGWVHSSPAVAGGTVFVGTVNVPAEVTPTFNWVELASGKLAGRFELPGAVYSSPTVWDTQVLVGCRDRRLYAFDRGMAQTQPVWTYETSGYLHASPVVVGDTILINSYGGHLYALRSARPIELWRPDDVVPRWFLAALVRQLHEETAAQVVAAARQPVGTELSLTRFEPLFEQVKAAVAKPAAERRVLPRDVPPDHPGAPFIEYALTAGLLGGYPDGTFQPTEPVSRYQLGAGLSSVLAQVLRPDFAWRELSAGDLKNTAVTVETRAKPGRRISLAGDVPDGHWAQTAVNDLATRGMLALDDEGRLRGDRLVTVTDARQQWDLIADSLKITRTK